MVAAAQRVSARIAAMVFHHVVRRRFLSGADARDMPISFRATGDGVAGRFMHGRHVDMVRMVLLVRGGFRRDGFVESVHEAVRYAMVHQAVLGGHRGNRLRDCGECLGACGSELHSLQGSGDTIAENPAKC